MNKFHPGDWIKVNHDGPNMLVGKIGSIDRIVSINAVDYAYVTLENGHNTYFYKHEIDLYEVSDFSLEFSI